MKEKVLYQKEWEQVKEILKKEQDTLRLAKEDGTFYAVQVQENTLEQIFKALQAVKYSDQPAKIDGLVMSCKLGLQDYLWELEKVKKDEISRRSLIRSIFSILEVMVQEEKPFRLVAVDFQCRVIKSIIESLFPNVKIRIL
ncbi:MAG: hypothetical protein PHE59_02090 [Patescibacteria group bacterium]|nr:hypothetical protein [Patescibacteria group bacterium]MDD5164739.1 hypothetical protein [Patescibacteria group bacterium]MDD5534572.1 hypothetical protein [Patescibacteria group bacterium]